MLTAIPQINVSLDEAVVLATEEFVAAKTDIQNAVTAQQVHLANALKTM